MGFIPRAAAWGAHLPEEEEGLEAQLCDPPRASKVPRGRGQSQKARGPGSPAQGVPDPKFVQGMSLQVRDGS